MEQRRGVMSVEYKVNQLISSDQFIELLMRSGLAERRPIDDLECMAGMVINSNLLVTAWHGERLVGVARSMTDFHYACYLSDLAVDKHFQRQGIGKALITETQKQLEPQCKLILISAPDANEYYPSLGFVNNPRCWVLEQPR